MASTATLQTSGSMDMETVASLWGVAPNLNAMEIIIRPFSDGSGTLTVFPDDFYGAIFLGISPATSSKPSSSGSVSYVIISAQSWTASDNASWITLSSTSGSGNSGFTATLSANSSSSSRTGTITLTNSGGISVTATITQAGATVSYSSVSLRNSTNASSACTAPSSTYYVYSGESFTSADDLFSNTSGKRAASGWYSDGSLARYWSGSSFGSSQLCFA